MCKLELFTGGAKTTQQQSACTPCHHLIRGPLIHWDTTDTLSREERLKRLKMRIERSTAIVSRSNVFFVHKNKEISRTFQGAAAMARCHYMAGGCGGSAGGWQSQLCAHPLVPDLHMLAWPGGLLALTPEIFLYLLYLMTQVIWHTKNPKIWHLLKILVHDN